MPHSEAGEHSAPWRSFCAGVELLLAGPRTRLPLWWMIVDRGVERFDHAEGGDGCSKA